MTTTAAPCVLVNRSNGVLIITLNRPNVRNAVDQAMAEAVAAALDELDSSPELRAGIITGAGPSFCAGMDLNAFLRGERPVAKDRGFAGIVEQPPKKPMIAAVEGHAVGGGFELVLACDLIVAAENAVFGLPEVKRGLVAAGGALLRLAERVPYHLAMEWALTGGFVGAEQAHAVRLVNRLTPVGQALPTALELANEIAANAPLAVQATKEIIVSSRDWPAAEAFDRQRPIAEAVRASHDAAEGARAFRERRAPRWEGR
jgi:Enoyl-CoA hydratase/carnithine racemase